MNLKRPLPSDRTYEQILNHYNVEKEYAKKLKEANREERKIIYATMYNELFRLVPDHSRLIRRTDDVRTARVNKSKMRLIRPFIDDNTIFAEFAPGDCKFSFEVAKLVKLSYGIDISDQRMPTAQAPDNFNLIIYDGYELKGINNSSLDIIFSDQLIEHFHPEDTIYHFKLIHQLLKKGGRYIFRTPNYVSGPHDISKYFSDEPEGFHLKEWTHVELKHLLRKVGFSKINAYRTSRMLPLPFAYFETCETILQRFPKNKTRKISKVLLGNIIISTVK